MHNNNQFEYRWINNAFNIMGLNKNHHKQFTKMNLIEPEEYGHLR